jgi:hypothetical protein
MAPAIVRFYGSGASAALARLAVPEGALGEAGLGQRGARRSGFVAAACVAQARGHKPRRAVRCRDRKNFFASQRVSRLQSPTWKSRAAKSNGSMIWR